MAKRGDGYSQSSRWKPVARNEELRVSLVEKRNSKESAALPGESFTPNRIYATLRPDGQLKQIKVYNAERREVARLDFDHEHKGLKEHVQLPDKRYRGLNVLERGYVERVKKWLDTLHSRR